MGTCPNLCLRTGGLFSGCFSLEEEQRQEPGFIVTPLVTKQQVQQSELENLCNRIFAGSSKDFILSFISRESVSEEELAELKAAVQEYHR